jgi:DNA-binding NarL/FixJ family response regulator
MSAHGAHGNIAPHPVSKEKTDSLLSAREVEVALLLCQGCINKEVADKLNISITTVITHRKNIMEKLGARSLADVIIYCVMNGIYNV